MAAPRPCGRLREGRAVLSARGDAACPGHRAGAGLPHDLDTRWTSLPARSPVRPGARRGPVTFGARGLPPPARPLQQGRKPPQGQRRARPEGKGPAERDRATDSPPTPRLTFRESPSSRKSAVSLKTATGGARGTAAKMEAAMATQARRSGPLRFGTGGARRWRRRSPSPAGQGRRRPRPISAPRPAPPPPPANGGPALSRAPRGLPVAAGARPVTRGRGHRPGPAEPPGRRSALRGAGTAGPAGVLRTPAAARVAGRSRGAMPRAARGAAGDAVPKAALLCWGSARGAVLGVHCSGCSARGHGTVPVGHPGLQISPGAQSRGERSPGVLCPGCRMVLACEARRVREGVGDRAQV